MRTYPFVVPTGTYVLSVGQVDSPCLSARGLTQSKTLRELLGGWNGHQRLDCASPLALSDDVGGKLNGDKGTRRLRCLFPTSKRR